MDIPKANEVITHVLDDANYKAIRKLLILLQKLNVDKDIGPNMKGMLACSERLTRKRIARSWQNRPVRTAIAYFIIQVGVVLTWTYLSTKDLIKDIFRKI